MRWSNEVEACDLVRDRLGKAGHHEDPRVSSGQLLEDIQPVVDGDVVMDHVAHAREPSDRRRKGRREGEEVGARVLAVHAASQQQHVEALHIPKKF